MAVLIQMRLLMLKLQHPEQYFKFVSLNKALSPDGCVDEFINQIKLHMNGINYLVLCDVIITNRDNGDISHIQKNSYDILKKKGLCNGPLKTQFKRHAFLYLTQCQPYIWNEHQQEPVIIDVIGIETQYEGGPAYKRDINTIVLVVPSQRRRKKETIKLTGLA
jgi:hypothetical protein